MLCLGYRLELGGKYAVDIEKVVYCSSRCWSRVDYREAECPRALENDANRLVAFSEEVAATIADNFVRSMEPGLPL